MSQMCGDNIDVAVSKGKVVCDASLVSDHLTHGSFGKLSRADIGNLVV